MLNCSKQSRPFNILADIALDPSWILLTIVTPRQLFRLEQKTGPNSPVRYPSRPFTPALKPILERFDFVKFSRF